MLTSHAFRIVDLDDGVPRDSVPQQPYTVGGAAGMHDPNTPGRTIINEGNPWALSQPNLFRGVLPRRTCPSMIGPFAHADSGLPVYYCSRQEAGYCDRRSGTCFCAAGYAGKDCGRCAPSHVVDARNSSDGGPPLCMPRTACPNDCSGAGKCDTLTGTCVCDRYRRGIDCSLQYCRMFDRWCTTCDEQACRECEEGYFLDFVSTGNSTTSVCRSCAKHDPRCLSCDVARCLVCADPLLRSYRRSGRRRVDPIPPADEELLRQLPRTVPFGSREETAFDGAETLMLYDDLYAQRAAGILSDGWNPMDACLASADLGEEAYLANVSTAASAGGKLSVALFGLEDDAEGRIRRYNVLCTQTAYRDTFFGLGSDGGLRPAVSGPSAALITTLARLPVLVASAEAAAAVVNGVDPTRAQPLPLTHTIATAELALAERALEALYQAAALTLAANSSTNPTAAGAASLEVLSLPTAARDVLTAADLLTTYNDTVLNTPLEGVVFGSTLSPLTAYPPSLAVRQRKEMMDGAAGRPLNSLVFSRLYDAAPFSSLTAFFQGVNGSAPGGAAIAALPAAARLNASSTLSQLTEPAVAGGNASPLSARLLTPAVAALLARYFRHKQGLAAGAPLANADAVLQALRPMLEFESLPGAWSESVQASWNLQRVDGVFIQRTQSPRSSFFDKDVALAGSLKPLLNASAFACDQGTSIMPLSTYAEVDIDERRLSTTFCDELRQSAPHLEPACRAAPHADSGWAWSGSLDALHGDTLSAAYKAAGYVQDAAPPLLPVYPHVGAAAYPLLQLAVAFRATSGLAGVGAAASVLDNYTLPLSAQVHGQRLRGRKSSWLPRDTSPAALHDAEAWVCRHVPVTNVECGSAGSIEFAAPSYVVYEGDGALRLTVVRSGGGMGRVTVKYEVIHLTTSDADVAATSFYTTSQTLVMEPGVVQLSFLLTIFDDKEVEGVDRVGQPLGSSHATRFIEVDANGTLLASHVTLLDANVTEGARSVEHAPGSTSFNVRTSAPSASADGTWLRSLGPHELFRVRLHSPCCGAQLGVNALTQVAILDDDADAASARHTSAYGLLTHDIAFVASAAASASMGLSVTGAMSRAAQARLTSAVEGLSYAVVGRPTTLRIQPRDSRGQVINSTRWSRMFTNSKSAPGDAYVPVSTLGGEHFVVSLLPLGAHTVLGAPATVHTESVSNAGVSNSGGPAVHANTTQETLATVAQECVTSPTAGAFLRSVDLSAVEAGSAQSATRMLFYLPDDFATAATLAVSGGLRAASFRAADVLTADAVYNASTGLYEAVLTPVSAGAHALVVQHVLPGGLAGYYYNNSRLEGTPLLRRIDAHIAFRWGLGPLFRLEATDSCAQRAQAPALVDEYGDVPILPLPAAPDRARGCVRGRTPRDCANSAASYVDHVSIRWSGKLRPDATTGGSGEYRFAVVADDGVRLWIDGNLVLDAWDSSSAYASTGDKSVVEIPESGGAADDLLALGARVPSSADLVQDGASIRATQRSLRMSSDLSPSGLRLLPELPPNASDAQVADDLYQVYAPNPDAASPTFCTYASLGRSAVKNVLSLEYDTDLGATFNDVDMLCLQGSVHGFNASVAGPGYFSSARDRVASSSVPGRYARTRDRIARLSSLTDAASRTGGGSVTGRAQAALWVSVSLEGGHFHDIVLEYRDLTGYAACELMWVTPLMTHAADTLRASFESAGTLGSTPVETLASLGMSRSRGALPVLVPRHVLFSARHISVLDAVEEMANATASVVVPLSVRRSPSMTYVHPAETHVDGALLAAVSSADGGVDLISQLQNVSALMPPVPCKCGKEMSGGCDDSARGDGSPAAASSCTSASDVNTYDALAFAGQLLSADMYNASDAAASWEHALLPARGSLMEAGCFKTSVVGRTRKLLVQPRDANNNPRGILGASDQFLGASVSLWLDPVLTVAQSTRASRCPDTGELIVGGGNQVAYTVSHVARASAATYSSTLQTFLRAEAGARASAFEPHAQALRYLTGASVSWSSADSTTRMAWQAYASGVHAVSVAMLRKQEARLQHIVGSPLIVDIQAPIQQLQPVPSLSTVFGAGILPDAGGTVVGQPLAVFAQPFDSHGNALLVQMAPHPVFPQAKCVVGHCDCIDAVCVVDELSAPAQELVDALGDYVGALVLSPNHPALQRIAMDVSATRVDASANEQAATVLGASFILAVPMFGHSRNDSGSDMPPSALSVLGTRVTVNYTSAAALRASLQLSPVDAGFVDSVLRLRQRTYSLLMVSVYTPRQAGLYATAVTLKASAEHLGASPYTVTAGPAPTHGPACTLTYHTLWNTSALAVGSVTIRDVYGNIRSESVGVQPDHADNNVTVVVESEVAGAYGPTAWMQVGNVTYAGSGVYNFTLPCNGLLCLVHVRVKGSHAAGSPFVFRRIAGRAVPRASHAWGAGLTLAYADTPTWALLQLRDAQGNARMQPARTVTLTANNSADAREQPTPLSPALTAQLEAAGYTATHARALEAAGGVSEVYNHSARMVLLRVADVWPDALEQVPGGVRWQASTPLSGGSVAVPISGIPITRVARMDATAGLPLAAEDVSAWLPRVDGYTFPLVNNTPFVHPLDFNVSRWMWRHDTAVPPTPLHATVPAATCARTSCLGRSERPAVVALGPWDALLGISTLAFDFDDTAPWLNASLAAQLLAPDASGALRLNDTIRRASEAGLIAVHAAVAPVPASNGLLLFEYSAPRAGVYLTLIALDDVVVLNSPLLVPILPRDVSPDACDAVLTAYGSQLWDALADTAPIMLPSLEEMSGSTLAVDAGGADNSSSLPAVPHASSTWTLTSTVPPSFNTSQADAASSMSEYMEDLCAPPLCSAQAATALPILHRHTYSRLDADVAAAYPQAATLWPTQFNVRSVYISAGTPVRLDVVLRDARLNRVSRFGVAAETLTVLWSRGVGEAQTLRLPLAVVDTLPGVLSAWWTPTDVGEHTLVPQTVGDGVPMVAQYYAMPGFDERYAVGERQEGDLSISLGGSDANTSDAFEARVQQLNLASVRKFGFFRPFFGANTSAPLAQALKGEAAGGESLCCAAPMRTRTLTDACISSWRDDLSAQLRNSSVACEGERGFVDVEPVAGSECAALEEETTFVVVIYNHATTTTGALPGALGNVKLSILAQGARPLTARLTSWLRENGAAGGPDDPSPTRAASAPGGAWTVLVDTVRGVGTDTSSQRAGAGANAVNASLQVSVWHATVRLASCVSYGVHLQYDDVLQDRVALAARLGANTERGGIPDYAAATGSSTSSNARGVHVYVHSRRLNSDAWQADSSSSSGSGSGGHTPAWPTTLTSMYSSVSKPIPLPSIMLVAPWSANVGAGAVRARVYPGLPYAPASRLTFETDELHGVAASALAANATDVLHDLNSNDFDIALSVGAVARAVVHVRDRFNNSVSDYFLPSDTSARAPPPTIRAFAAASAQHERASALSHSLAPYMRRWSTLRDAGMVVWALAQPDVTVQTAYPHAAGVDGAQRPSLALAPSHVAAVVGLPSRGAVTLSFTPQRAGKYQLYVALTPPARLLSALAQVETAALELQQLQLAGMNGTTADAHIVQRHAAVAAGVSRLAQLAEQCRCLLPPAGAEAARVQPFWLAYVVPMRYAQPDTVLARSYMFDLSHPPTDVAVSSLLRELRAATVDASVMVAAPAVAMQAVPTPLAALQPYALPYSAAASTAVVGIPGVIFLRLRDASGEHRAALEQLSHADAVQLVDDTAIGSAVPSHCLFGARDDGGSGDADTPAAVLATCGVRLRAAWRGPLPAQLDAYGDFDPLSAPVFTPTTPRARIFTPNTTLSMSAQVWSMASHLGGQVRIYRVVYLAAASGVFEVSAWLGSTGSRIRTPPVIIKVQPGVPAPHTGNIEYAVESGVSDALSMRAAFTAAARRSAAAKQGGQYTAAAEAVLQPVLRVNVTHVAWWHHANVAHITRASQVAEVAQCWPASSPATHPFPPEVVARLASDAVPATATAAQLARALQLSVERMHADAVAAAAAASAAARAAALHQHTLFEHMDAAGVGAQLVAYFLGAYHRTFWSTPALDWSTVLGNAASGSAGTCWTDAQFAATPLFNATHEAAALLAPVTRLRSRARDANWNPLVHTRRALPYAVMLPPAAHHLSSQLPDASAVVVAAWRVASAPGSTLRTLLDQGDVAHHTLCHDRTCLHTGVTGASHAMAGDSMRLWSVPAAEGAHPTGGSIDLLMPRLALGAVSAASGEHAATARNATALLEEYAAWGAFSAAPSALTWLVKNASAQFAVDMSVDASTPAGASRASDTTLHAWLQRGASAHQLACIRNSSAVRVGTPVGACGELPATHPATVVDASAGQTYLAPTSTQRQGWAVPVHAHVGVVSAWKGDGLTLRTFTSWDAAFAFGKHGYADALRDGNATAPPTQVVRSVAYNSIWRAPVGEPQVTAAVWSGFLAVPTDAVYTFTLLTDSPVELLLDGIRVIVHAASPDADAANAWQGGARNVSGSIVLRGPQLYAVHMTALRAVPASTPPAPGVLHWFWSWNAGLQAASVPAGMQPPVLEEAGVAGNQQQVDALFAHTYLDGRAAHYVSLPRDHAQLVPTDMLYSEHTVRTLRGGPIPVLLQA